MVLACSHRRSLQLLSTVGGNQARSDARSEFEILEPKVESGARPVLPKAPLVLAKALKPRLVLII